MYFDDRRKYPLAIVTPNEIEALVRACSDRASTGIRNRGLIMVMYDTGLRISEALAALPADVDRTMKTLTVPGRNGRGRRVLLGEAAFSVLEGWLERRQALGLGQASPLFCTLQGRRIQTPYVRALLPRLARKAGIAKRVHPRGLRDAHAAQLAARRVPLELVQARLGHSSPVTTDRLLRRVAAYAISLRSTTNAHQPSGATGAPHFTDDSSCQERQPAPVATTRAES